ncbi:hypothetical protein [Diaphorobacter aerolatus]|uniref:Tripartite tricarboxylate transporter substrate binding protein n=1 Tax=Diaphorobacter aerolatus TaxID=1288495 RepID=A0A7H0GIP5_9BURK|nr:hypothetical protein [Diaphorobacter aerolatus]QNP48161.1 hypothetical protein H9K75_19315 [Diaphorobacter aerolatus]
MRMNRRSFVITTAATGLTLSTASRAAAYPEHPIKLIVPYPPAAARTHLRAPWLRSWARSSDSRS